LIKYTKSVLWRVAKRLSYIQDAGCLKVKHTNTDTYQVALPAIQSSSTLWPWRWKQ